MLMMNELIGFGQIYDPPSVTFASSAVSASNLTTYTFASQSISTAKDGRYIVVGIYQASAPLVSVSTVTVGGVSATIIGSAASAANNVVVFYGVRVNEGTTATIEVTFSGGALCASIGVWALYDLNSFTAVDTGTSTANPGTDTLTTRDGGVAIAFAAGNAIYTCTWTGLTENFDATVDAPQATSHSGASSLITTGSSLSITATRSSAPTQSVMVTASFR
jgi:hypothetical protein